MFDIVCMKCLRLMNERARLPNKGGFKLTVSQIDAGEMGEAWLSITVQEEIWRNGCPLISDPLFKETGQTAAWSGGTCL